MTTVAAVPPLPDAASAEDVAAILNAVCTAAVEVARGRDAAAIAAFGRELEARAEAFRNCGHGSVAGFLVGLRRLLEGTPLAVVQADLADPFREGIELVAEDIAAAAADADDWVAALAARVATILRQRDRDAARQLAGQLRAALAAPGVDPDAAAYFDILLGVLAGTNVRLKSVRLAEPYRTAYFSLEAVLKGGDPRAGLVHRVRDSALSALQGADAPVREGLSAAFAQSRADALRAGEAELARFIEAVSALLDGAGAGAGTVAPFADPGLRRAWAEVLAAWKLAGARPGSAPSSAGR